MSTSTNRIGYFDLLKGLAIISVVTWHVMNDMGYAFVENTRIHTLMEYLQLPVFFFVSGYFCYKSNGTQSFISPNLIVRFKQLMFPTIFFAGIFGGLFWQSIPELGIGQRIYNLFVQNWFLPCLFILYSIYYLLSLIIKPVKHEPVRIVIFLIVLLALLGLTKINIPKTYTILFQIEYLGRFFIPFMIGVYAHRYKNEYEHLITNNRILGIAIIIAFCSYIYFFSIGAIAGIGFMAVHAFVISSLLIIVSSAYNLYTNNTTLPKWVAVIENIGRKSLAIYLLHFYFRFDLTSMQPLLADINVASLPLLAISLFIAIFIIGASMLSENLLSKNDTIALLMLGKTKH